LRYNARISLAGSYCLSHSILADENQAPSARVE
jgi:hypothetical protein